MKKFKKNKNKQTPTIATRQSTIPPINKYPWAVLLFLFSLSFFYRFYFMNDGLFHHDEVLLANAVEGSMEKQQLLGIINGRYGTVLLNILFYVPYKWFTGYSSEKVIVFTAILSGGLLAAVTYVLARELSGDIISAFFSSLFITFNFLFLTTSTIGKEHTHQLLFVAMAFWLFHRGARVHSLTFKILGLASFAFAVTVHESTIPLTPVFVLFLFLVNRSFNGQLKTQLQDLGIFCGLLAVPFVLYLGRVFLKTLTVMSTSIVSFMGLFSPVLPKAINDLFISTGIPLALLALVGIAANGKKWKIVIPAVFWVLTIFYYGNTSGYTTRHLILLILPISILGGMGAGYFIGKVKNPSIQAASGLLLILLVSGYGIYKSYPLINFRKNYCGPKKMALFVKANTKPEDIIITMDESVYIDYYADRDVMTHPVAEYAPNREFVERVRTIALSGRTFYVNSTAFSYDYMKHFRNLMLENFQFIYVGEVMDEDYHRPELKFMLFKNKLFRIVPK